MPRMSGRAPLPWEASAPYNPGIRPLSASIEGSALMTAPTYEKLTPPSQGTRVTVSSGGVWTIPDDPIVCLLRGDGIGLDAGGVPGITACAVKVLDAAVAQAYGGKRKIAWFDV